MSDINPNIKSVVVRINTNKPVRKTPYQVKGVFMRHYSNQKIIPMLDGSVRERFLYPRAQVKILNEQIYLIGINEGVEPVLDLYENLTELNFGNITFEIEDCDVEIFNNQFIPSSELIRYRFITPWVALNKVTGGKYKFLTNQEKPSYLNKLLGQNIVFLANELGIGLKEDILTKVKVSSLFPKSIDENKWGAFMGEFKTNFVLPSFVGIGNGITRGYGTIYGQINKDTLIYKGEKDKDTESEEKLESSEDVEIISFTDVPKPRRKKHLKKKKRKKFQSKNKNQKTHKKNRKDKETNFQSRNSAEKNKKHYKSKHKSGNFLSDKPDIEDDNKISEQNDDYKFNTEKHHKKQHKF